MFGFKRKEKKILVPALFLHIQKTAGSSMVKIARKHYGFENMISHGDYIDRQPNELEDVSFISGHFGYDYAKLLFPGRYSFTFLRDPVERVLSMYSYCREQNPNEYPIYEAANKMSLDEFIEAGFEDECVKKNIQNRQIWQLAHGNGCLDNCTVNNFSELELINLAKKHLEKFSYVGFLEFFKEDRDKILRELGISAQKDNAIVNPSRRKLNKEDIPNGLRERIEELTRLDSVIYDYALSCRKTIRV